METISWYYCECGHTAGYMAFGHKSKVDGRKCKGVVTRHIYAKVPGLSETVGPAS